MLYRKSTLAVLLGLIFLSFFGTLCLSAWMFPENYDWRYRVISNLLSPRDNPSHHWLPACGIALAEFLGRSAAAFMAVGMLCGCWCAWKGGRSRFPARLFWTWSLVTLLPVAGIFFSESLLLLTRLKPSWAMPIRSVLRHSVVWHLGFWEWSGAAAVFIFLCATVFLTSPRATLAVENQNSIRLSRILHRAHSSHL